MKDFMSVYKPNVRKNGGWYKIKPEYTDGLMDELDVLILGGYRGGGRHHGGYSHFMIGVAVPPVPPHTTPQVFHSMGRVGSGYNMGELSELQNKLEPHWNVRIGTSCRLISCGVGRSRMCGSSHATRLYFRWRG